VHVFIGMDIAHKFRTDRSKSNLNSILTLTYSIGNEISDVHYKRMRLSGEQKEYPIYKEYKKIMVSILNETKEWIKANSNPNELIIPWINFIRDGLYQLSKSNRIDELENLRASIQDKFTEFNLVYMN